MSVNLKTFVSLLKYDNSYNYLTMDTDKDAKDYFVTIFNDYIKYYKLKYGNTINFNVPLRMLFKLDHCLDSIEPLIVYSLENVLYSEPYFIMKEYAFNNNLTLISHIMLEAYYLLDSYKHIKNPTLEELCDHVLKMIRKHETEIEDEIEIKYNYKNIMFKVNNDTYIEISNTDITDGEAIKNYIIRKYFETNKN